jgi:hypothetical protein
MLRCNIALAACGANSQLCASAGGEFSEPEFARREYLVDIRRFSIFGTAFALYWATSICQLE